MTLLGSIASLFLKRASNAEGIIALVKNVDLYVGGVLYLTSAIINVWILRHLDYSVVLPLTSLTYLWTMFWSYMILKERVTGKKIAGIVLILLGAICVSL